MSAPAQNTARRPFWLAAGATAVFMAILALPKPDRASAPTAADPSLEAQALVNGFFDSITQGEAAPAVTATTWEQVTDTPARDLFRPLTGDPAPTAPPDPDAATDEIPADPFVYRGSYGEGTRRIAFIGEGAVAVGDTLLGHRLIHVTENLAVLRHPIHGDRHLKRSTP